MLDDFFFVVIFSEVFVVLMVTRATRDPMSDLLKIKSIKLMDDTTMSDDRIHHNVL